MIITESTLQDIGVIFGVIGPTVAIWVVFWGRVKPEIDVYCNEDGKKHVNYKPNMDFCLNFFFKNIGKKPFFNIGLMKKSAVLQLLIMIYFPSTFQIQEAERQNAKTCMIFTTPTIPGRFANMKYVFVPDPFNRKPPVMSSLRFKEVESCRVKVKTPNQEGPCEVRFDMSSKEKALATKKIIIKIKN
jgi:hypothetical protein